MITPPANPLDPSWHDTVMAIVITIAVYAVLLTVIRAAS